MESNGIRSVAFLIKVGNLHLIQSTPIIILVSTSNMDRLTLVDELPVELSKDLCFNAGSNQFKVGQQYTDVLIVTLKEKVCPKQPNN